jgi:hypothetical protein
MQMLPTTAKDPNVAIDNVEIMAARMVLPQPSIQQKQLSDFPPPAGIGIIQ